MGKPWARTRRIVGGQYGEGFCPHTALATMRALEDGSLAR